ncbi:transposase, MuDR, MULE transposase domain protein [Tanacetum coccineum]
MSFKPDIPETPLYKSKPMISKDYKKETDVKVGNIFDNKEALDLAIRLKALDEGYQFLNDRSAPERTKKRRDSNTYKNRRKRSIRDVIHCPWCVNSYVRELSTAIAYNRCGTHKGSIQGNKSDSCRHGWKQPNCANCFWYMQKGNRHAAIALAVQNEFSLAYHAAYTTEEFLSSMSHLQDIQPDAYEKLCQVSPQRWSKAHCPLVHYNYLTSNSVESVNACIVVHRKLPVLKLAETYHAMVQDWYYKRHKFAENMTYEITDWAANKVQKNMMKSAKWVVCGVSDHQYQVNDGGYNRQVDFQTGTCQCRKWQLSGLPCGHVIAVTRNVQEWEFPQHIRKAIPPRMDNPQPDFADMITYLTRKISRRFTTLYYTLPPNNTLSGLKQIKNDYDTNVMYDIAKVAGKIQLFVSHHQIDLSTMLIPNDGSLEEAFAVHPFHIKSMADSANDARKTIVSNLQRELEAEATLANTILGNLTRYFEQMRIREIQITMLQNMPTMSLNSYGLHALLMTHEADIRTTNNLIRARQELLRSIAEKQKFINNYRAI